MKWFLVYTLIEEGLAHFTRSIVFFLKNILFWDHVDPLLNCA